MAPVDVSNDRPVGSDGVIDQEVIVPPLAVGVIVVIATFTVSVDELGLYVIEEGAASVTSMVTVAVALPPEFDAVTVYVAEEVIAVGVPEIVPVDTSNDKPDGSDGETLHDVTAPPDAVGIALDITEPFCNVNEFGV